MLSCTKSLSAISILLTLLAACDDGNGNMDVLGAPPPNTEQNLGCALGCHGDSSSNAPPVDTKGMSDTTLRSVGAHRAHLNSSPTWHGKIQCNDCHTVPSMLGDPAVPSHLDGKVEVVFSALAVTSGAMPMWNGTTCSGAYCHGATLTGGTATAANWTKVDGTQANCGSCHGLPPSAPHPAGTDCGTCHPTMQPGTMTFLDPASHINGKVDLAQGTDPACDACHGSGGNSAPPRDLKGNTATTFAGVGAHRAHLDPSTSYAQIVCSQCHPVPATVGAPGHMNGVVDVAFTSLNPGAAFTLTAGTCQTLYCHGNGWSMPGAATWTSQTALTCTSCHAMGTGAQPMSGQHTRHLRQGIHCTDCHNKVVDANNKIISSALHVNGVHEVNFRQGGTFDQTKNRCTNLTCHEPQTW